MSNIALKNRLGIVSTLLLVASLTAACGANPGTPGDDGGTGGMAGSGGTGPGGSAGTAGSGGGGALPFDSSDIQLNDVSILFPLPADDRARDAGMLDMKAAGTKGQLLPEALYQGVGPIVGSTDVSGGLVGGDLGALYSNLRVVAARIDPCFAALDAPADGAGCENQLRLVVQEVVAGEAADSALHLFYAISREEVLELVQAIGGLRQSLKPRARLGGLKPHPIMVEEGLNGAMARGVEAAILAHAGAQNLVRITRMSAKQGPFWDFSGFDVSGGKLAAMHIPTLPAGSDTRQTFLRDFAFEPTPTADPPSGSDDDFIVLEAPKAAQALGRDEQDAAFAKLLRVENPGFHSPNTIDCVTCHIATPATKLVAEPLLGLTADDAPDAFKAGKSVPASELSATFENEEPLTNVHAFSYTGTRAGINQRTVNESAAVVEYLSGQEFPGQP
jgi:hypothetical protein